MTKDRISLIFSLTSFCPSSFSCCCCCCSWFCPCRSPPPERKFCTSEIKPSTNPRDVEFGTMTMPYVAKFVNCSSFNLDYDGGSDDDIFYVPPKKEENITTEGRSVWCSRFAISTCTCVWYLTAPGWLLKVDQSPSPCKLFRHLIAFCIEPATI